MINPELLSFIEKELTAGMLPDKIRETLATAGWNSADVEQAFSSISSSVPNALPAPVEPITVIPNESVTQATPPKTRVGSKHVGFIVAGLLVLSIVGVLLVPIVLGLVYRGSAAVNDTDLKIGSVSVAELENSYADFAEAGAQALIFETASASSSEQIVARTGLVNALTSAYTKNGYQNPLTANATTTVVSDANYAGLSKLVSLSNENAQLLAAKGKSAEALQAAVVGIIVGSRMEQSQESLLGIVVAMGFKQDSLRTIQKIVPVTRFDSKELIRLADWLGQQRNDGATLVRAQKWEYQTIANSISGVPATSSEKTNSLVASLKNSPWNATGLYYFPNETNGYVQSHVRRLVNDAQTSCETYLGDEVSSQKERTMFESLKTQSWQWPVTANVYGKLLFSAYSNASKSTVKTSTCNENMSVGGVQLILAIRAYEQDKKILPQTLSELVPLYVKELPTDPWSGASYVYVPARRVIYSVGTLHKDTGGIGVENPSFAF